MNVVRDIYMERNFVKVEERSLEDIMNSDVFLVRECGRSREGCQKMSEWLG